MSDTSTEGSAGLPAPGGDGQEGGGSAAPGLDYNSILRNGFGRMMQGDVALALGVSAILVVLILPLPNWLLDVALAVSITFSVMILMTCSPEAFQIELTDADSWFWRGRRIGCDRPR